MVGIRFVLWCICFPTWPQIMYITVIQRKLFSLLLTYHCPSFPEPSHLSYCCDLTHSTFHVSLSSSFTSRSGSSCTSLPPCAFPLLLATPEELSLLLHLSRFYISLTQEASLSCIRALVAQMVKNLPTMQETQVQSLGWEDLLEKGMAAH